MMENNYFFNKMNKNNQIKIIVVEDDIGLSELIKSNLKKIGYSVHVVNESKKAFNICLAENFDLLIIDYFLPELDGEEFIKELKLKSKCPPFIVISGASELKNVISMMKLGAEDYLPKDIDFIRLLPELVKRVANDIKTRKELIGAEKKIKESKEELNIFQRFAAQAGQGLGIVNINGEFQYFNSSLCKILDYENSEEFKQVNFFELYPKSVSENFRNQIFPTVLRDGNWVGETELLTKKNKLIFAIQNVFIITRGIERLFAFLITDLTKLKKHEELLHLQSTTLEATANSIVISNKEGEIVWVNQAFSELTGYSKKEVLYKNVNILNSKQNDALIYDDLWNTITKGEVWRGELINMRKDGTLYIEEQTITPVKNSEGEIINYISIKQDITERKRIEKELKKLNDELEHRVLLRTDELNKVNKELAKQEEKFRRLFENSADAVVLVENDLIMECNPATLNMFKTTRDNFIGKLFTELVPIFQADGLNSKTFLLKKIVEATENKNAHFEIELKRTNDEIFFADVLLSISCLNNNKLIQVVIRDITGKKAAEEAIKQAEAKLIEAEKMAALGEMIAGVSHEINTPIGVCLTASTYLQENAVEFEKLFRHNKIYKKQLNDFLTTTLDSTKIINSNLKRAAGLIKSFKQVSSDQTSGETRIFNLKNYVDEIIVSLYPKLKKTNYKIVNDCDKKLEIKLKPGFIAQILTNLIVNSISHAFENREEGKIKISAKAKGEKLIITFKDNGCGIPEENISKLFNPFYTTKRGKGGTGLGLYVVYSLITTELNGEIICKSKIEKGTEFYITLPLINN